MTINTRKEYEKKSPRFFLWFQLEPGFPESHGRGTMWRCSGWWSRRECDRCAKAWITLAEIDRNATRVGVGNESEGTVCPTLSVTTRLVRRSTRGSGNSRRERNEPLRDRRNSRSCSGSSQMPWSRGGALGDVDSRRATTRKRRRRKISFCYEEMTFRLPPAANSIPAIYRMANPRNRFPRFPTCVNVNLGSNHLMTITF